MTDSANNDSINEDEVQSEETYQNEIEYRRKKLADLKSSGNDPFEITVFDRDTFVADIKDNFESLENKDVKIAGRIMSRRDMGKANFIDIVDFSGRLQIYVKINDIGKDSFDAFKTWDIGDIIGINGFVFRTRRGEISVHAKEIILLSKSLLPLPEKWHGLKDTDIRYRRRYLDLIVNPEVKDTFVKRSKIISETRRYLDTKGFLEVETPVLHTQAGGANARPFVTHHNTLDIDLHLRIAPELYLKRLIVGGFDKVYEIGRVFRNEGMSTRHNPEFTLLELYQSYTDFEGMMELTESLIKHLAISITSSGQVPYGDVTIDLENPFARMKMSDAVKEYAGVDFGKITTIEQARAVADERNVKYEQRHGVGDILNLFFEHYVEEKLIQPTFITYHPVEISPLAKRSTESPNFTERFELFILGREYANAFSELNDPIDQRERFEAQALLKTKGDEEACDVDEDYITALEYGMPPTGGLGVGMDRLIMLLTNTSSIRDVLLFPTMRPME